jgi:hypothetical protein
MAVLLVTSVSLFGESVFVGRVISIALGGGEGVLFVEPSRYDNTIGGTQPKPTTAVYIYANFGNAGTGYKFKFMGEYIGQVQYRTPIGEMATVSGFRGILIPIPPGQTNYLEPTGENLSNDNSATSLADGRLHKLERRRTLSYR